MLDRCKLENILKELRKERPIFHFEADFQYALALKIREKFSNSIIRLEKREKINGKNIKVDIFVYFCKEESCTYIELKYKTRKVEIELNTGDESCKLKEKYELKNQEARDIGGYDFCKDIERLENLVKNCSKCTGFAIFLTNDPSYWEPPQQKSNADAFRIYNGKILRGELKWGENTSENTMQGRKDPIVLTGKYCLEWKDYSKLGDVKEKGNFRYLLVEVKRNI